MTPSELPDRALEHIRHLVEQVGPRPAGSPAEQRAFDYIAARLEAAGLVLQRTPAPFAPLPGVSLPVVLAAAGFAAAGLGLHALPWLAVGLPFLVAALPELSRAVIGARRCSSASQNLLAGLPASPVAPRLILCAHVDSARAGPFDHPLLQRIHYHTLDVLQRLAIALAALGLVQMAGLRLPPVLAGLMAVLGCAAGAWLALVQFAAAIRSEYVPGAIDNASGVGLAMALAEHYAAHPPPGVALGFLFTGAEETGMHGARAAAARLRRETALTRLLVLDMVGAGSELRYVSSDGIYRPLKTDPDLNQRIARANPDARPMRYILRSGDHAAFIRAGIPAAAIQTSGSARADLAYHTPADGIDLVDVETLKMTASTLLAVIHDMDN